LFVRSLIEFQEQNSYKDFFVMADSNREIQG